MNELQIRLTADIAQLQSALTKAKNTIKSFESETAKESEKGNVGFRRKIGLIEQLTNKAKTLRTALSQATNEKQIESYNQELEKTTVELTRLNALGRSVTANLGSTAGGFSRFKKEGGGAIGVTQEFNRVIQDAPFGLIGVGNNLQQLATNFGTLRAQAGSTGKAVSLALSSIISPINLGLLAVSALTAGFTAYQMGSLDFIFGTEKAEESIVSLEDKLSDFIKTLGSVETANLNASKSIATERMELDALIGVIENENETRDRRVLALNKLRDLYPGYLQGLSDETILSQGLRDVYIEITDAITKRATALALEDELVNLAKERLELNKKLISDEDNFFQIQQQLIKAQAELDRLEEKRAKGQASASRVDLARDERDNLLELLSTAQELATETENGINTNKEAATQLGQEYQTVFADLLEVNSLTNEWDDNAKNIVRTYENISTALGDVLDRARNQRRDDFFTPVALAESTGIGIESGSSTTQGIFEQSIESKIRASEKLKQALDGSGISIDQFFQAIDNGAAKGFDSLADFIIKLSETQKFIEDATQVLERGIENTIGDVAFSIGDALAKGGNVLEAGGAALLAGLANILNQLGQLAIGTGIAIGGIKKALQTLNPAVAIGAGVALIALAGFVSSKARSLGGFGGGSGAGAGFGGSSAGASSGAPPQIFTNSQIPSVPGSSVPAPSGNIDFGNAQGKLEARIDGNDIVFVYDRTKERQQGGG